MTLKQKIIYSQSIIEKAISEFQNKVFISFSGGKDSRVLLDLVLKFKSDIKIIGIDTGYEFPETIDFTNQLVQKYNLSFEYIRPTIEQSIKILINYGFTEGLTEPVDTKFADWKGEPIKDGQWYCCAHKEPALQNFLQRKEYDAWITGLRADETKFRKYIPIYQKGSNQVQKINPLIFWTVKDIWKYIKQNKLEYHPKYGEGYKSLGCKPCTEAGFREGKGNQSKFENVGLSGEREGNSECGIWVSDKL